MPTPRFLFYGFLLGVSFYHLECFSLTSEETTVKSDRQDDTKIAAKIDAELENIQKQISGINSCKGECPTSQVSVKSRAQDFNAIFRESADREHLAQIRKEGVE